MNRLRIPVIIAIAIGLLAGSALGATAQSADVDPMAPAFVTGSITDGGTASTETQTAEDGFTRIEAVSGPDVWEASDSRLWGDVTYAGVWHRYPAPATMQVEAATHELLNAGGRCGGQATAIATATIGGWDAIVFRGAIFPGDMPTSPAPAVIE